MGCGESINYEVEGLVPVTGTVKVDGQPVANASVLFVPAGEGATGTAASATTDATGKYELVTGEEGQKGAKPGTYRVVISQYLKDGQPVAPNPEKSPMDLMIEGAKETMHANYSDMAFTKLQREVPTAGGTIDFELKADGSTP
jgi:hypothetical protein